jgi:hypothetical protein
MNEQNDQSEGRLLGPNLAPAVTYTSSRIAACLGRTAQAVRKGLRNVPRDGLRIVHGAEAATWSFPRLPESYRALLTEKARQDRYHDAEAMLSAPPKLWAPSLPLDKIADTDVAHATKLRSVLMPWLKEVREPSLSTTELEARGIADYARKFGNRITGRWWRELVDRTARRDGGAEDWGRLEIYLPPNPKPKEEPARVVVEALAKDFSELSSYIDACRRPPSEIDERGIWTMAFEQYDRLVATGTPAKRAARRLREFLFARASFLARSRGALLKAFKRKLARWEKDGKDAKALVDGRKDNGGDSFEFTQSDLDIIEAKIVFEYGQYAPAWQEALREGRLSEETRRRYSHRTARKCYVPEKLITTLGKRPLWLYIMHRRRREFNSLKAHFTTIYDGLRTLACISADDVTLPVYFYYFRPTGELVITRGQCLLFIDLVSKRILGWSLQPDPNYNALVIYTMATKVFAEKGVPRALLFEHGIWEKSKLITGSAPFSITEVTHGLKEFGIIFFNADSPEGKSETENVMGLIQNLMEVEPGYCGRDERKDRPDWLKRQLAEIQSAEHPVPPSKHFYSFDLWNARLGQIFERYNAGRQDGKQMKGRTPNGIYVDNWDTEDPPIRLGPELRFLLAHAKYEMVVKPSGVSITSGKRTFKYYGEELKELVGHPVLVWFNPELPDVVVVTDLQRGNPIAVPLAPDVPRLERLTNPEGTILANACKRREQQCEAIVARYNVLKDKFELPYRRNLVAAQTLALGQQIESQTAAIRKEKADRTDRMDKMRGRARAMGIPAAMVDDDPETRRALELFAEAERDHREDGTPTPPIKPQSAL